MNKVKNLLAYTTAFFMSRNAKAWKFKRALLQKEKPCRAKTLWNVSFL